MRLNELAGRMRCTRGGLKSRHVYRWALIALMVIVYTSGTAMAQLPFMFVDDAGVFEGNSGTTILKLPVRFVGTQNLTVTGTVSAIPLSGAGFNTPIGGSTCGTGVDFQPFSNVPFSIPPNTPNGTLSVNITICGDTTVEPDEQIFVFFSNVVGADCSLEGACNGIGTIVNDDGPPGITINNINVSTLKGLERTVNFTVSLHHPSTLPVSVHFATRDGTMKAVGIGPFGSTVGGYFATSGTLSIPAGSLTGLIPVTINGQLSGTFFMDLSSPVNGTIVDGTGQATIQLQTLTVGNFEVTPDDSSIPVGDRANFAVTWTVPAGEVWRNLNTIDVRFRKGNQVPLWLRWNEAANTLALCEENDAGNAVCSPGKVLVSRDTLETSLARVFLADSSAVGSGPTGPDVTLNLAIEFLGKAAGHLYDIEVAATDDLGHADDFVTASTVHVETHPNK